MADDPWLQDVLGWRRMKDRYMREDPGSPLAPGLRGRFKALGYWVPDPRFRFRVALTKRTPPRKLVVMTSDGQPRDLLHVGELPFILDGRPLTLEAYAHQRDRDSSDDESAGIELFIPFRDATSGKESYDSGRYLDIHVPSLDDPVDLDFNRAYNPFCAYSEHYSCPLPPRANWLAMRIEAGEKAFTL